MGKSLETKLAYKHYMLGLLTVVATFNFLDRYVLFLLLEPIKQDFQLSDSQLGLLTGFAFALFYALAGLPIARWADRGNRNTIITITTALWSAMVALCGLVGSYNHLLLVRVGVAVGEAGCQPPAQSLIADYFDRDERPRAMAVYWMCGPISVIIGYLGGGLLAEVVGWRMTFILMGVPGILLAILVKLSLREPRLKLTTDVVVEQPSFKIVLASLSQQRAFRHIAMAFCVAGFFNTGIFAWLPAFLMRSHDMEVGDVGVWLAFIWGGGGLFGAYIGGVLVSRYAAGKEAIQIRVVAIIITLAGVLFVMAYLSSEKYNALMLMAMNGFLFALCNGPVFSAIQSLVNERMRSVALALIFLLTYLIGYGLGPIAVGVLSDLLVPSFGQESLRYASVLFAPGFLWVAYHYWKAGNTIEADIRRVESETGIKKTEAASLEVDTPALGKATMGSR